MKFQRSRSTVADYPSPAAPERGKMKAEPNHAKEGMGCIIGSVLGEQRIPYALDSLRHELSVLGEHGIKYTHAPSSLRHELGPGRAHDILCPPKRVWWAALVHSTGARLWYTVLVHDNTHRKI